MSELALVVVDGRVFRQPSSPRLSDAMLDSIARFNWAELLPAPGGFFTKDLSSSVVAVWYLRPGFDALVCWHDERVDVYQPGLFS